MWYIRKIRDIIKGDKDNDKNDQKHNNYFKHYHYVMASTKLFWDIVQELK